MARSLLFDRITVCDGAMGTMMHEKGIPLGSSFDEVNVSRPELVEEIHRGYLDAGAQIIETNTFGANRARLDSYGVGSQARAINIAGAKIARKCAGDGAFVAGSVGPTGKLMQPLGPMDFEEAFDIYREQISALCEGGVDLLIIETFQDLREAKAAVLAAKTVTEIPVVSQMSFSQEGRTIMGTTPDVSAVVLGAMGVRLVGTNCSTGPADMLDVVRAMAEVTSLGISAQPNAGLPRIHEGRLIYFSTPEYMADFARRFVEAGAILVGGCCGTTPAHIRAIVSAVSDMKPAPRSAREAMRVAGRTKLYEIGSNGPMLIGNRLSSWASGEIVADIEQGQFRLVQGEASSQFDNGAEILWIDCDRAGLGAAGRLIELVQSACPCAVCVAGSDIRTVEEALRSVEGRAFAMLRGPVSAVVEQLLPLAKRYGAAVVAGTDIGSGEGTPEERLRVSSRIVEAAKDMGMTRDDVMVHVGCLYDAGGGVEEESLRAIKLVKSELRVNVVADCAASERSEAACSSALKSAIDAGANAVIADPLDPVVRATAARFRG